MTNHPNRSRRYMGHTITRSDSVFLANNGRPLYAVEGKYTKPAAIRPFLITQKDAREWIAECLAFDNAPDV